MKIKVVISIPIALLMPPIFDNTVTHSSISGWSSKEMHPVYKVLHTRSVLGDYLLGRALKMENYNTPIMSTQV